MVVPHNANENTFVDLSPFDLQLEVFTIVVTQVHGLGLSLAQSEDLEKLLVGTAGNLDIGVTALKITSHLPEGYETTCQ